MYRKIFSYTKNIATYFGASLIPMALSLISNPWIAKNMSPEDYAISGYYTSFSTLLSPLIIFYLIHFYIKEYFKRDEEHRQKLYKLIANATIWFSGCVTLLCFGVMWSYMTFFTDLSFPVSPYLAMMVFALPLTGLLNLQLAQFRMEKKASAYFRLSVFNGILSVIISVLYVVWLKMGAYGKLLAPLTCNAIVFLIMAYKFRSYLTFRINLKEFKPVFWFCLPLALSAMLGYFTNGFSTSYLESIGDNNEYGIYVVGASIGAYLTVFATAISNTFQPDLYESTIKKQWRRFAGFCFLQVGLVAVVAMVFILCAPFIISVLTAGRYVASTPYAQIIAISTVTSSIYYLINNYTIATDHPKLYLYTSIFGSLLIVTLMPLAVYKWRYSGGAWMAVMSYIILASVNIMLLGLSRFKILPDKIWK